MQFFCPTLSIYSPGIQGKLKLKLKREPEKSYLGKKKRFNQLVEKLSIIKDYKCVKNMILTMMLDQFHFESIQLDNFRML